MAKDIKANIETGITRRETGKKPERALLQISTGKGFHRGVRSAVTVFWSDGTFMSTMLFGDFSKQISVTAGTATQNAINRQHAAVFTEAAVAALVEEVKAFYAPAVSNVPLADDEFGDSGKCAECG